jgi:hypothetical protein
MAAMVPVLVAMELVLVVRVAMVQGETTQSMRVDLPE